MYSPDDAIVSISFADDRVRAVVDAMERDPVTTIATKSDVQALRHELMSRMSGLATRDELRRETIAVRDDIAKLWRDYALVRKDMELLPTAMTVRLGSVVAIGLGILFAVLKLT
jgi:hypothetical protein